MEVRIENPDENGNGEILARGSNVMLGHDNMPGKTREAIDAEGWLHTGDIGKLDRDGCLSITGRLKNIIVTKDGKNIYPKEIENILSASPPLSEVRGLVRAEIQKCTAGAAVRKIPHGFEISREKLPKTSTRKGKRFMFSG